MIRKMHKFFDRDIGAYYLLAFGLVMAGLELPRSSYPLNAAAYSLWFALMVTRAWYHHSKPEESIP